MIVAISIGLFLFIIVISLIMLKLIKHYFNLSKTIEIDGDKAKIKIVGFFKKSMLFFIALNSIFLGLFLFFLIF